MLQVPEEKCEQQKLLLLSPFGAGVKSSCAQHRLLIPFSRLQHLTNRGDPMASGTQSNLLSSSQLSQLVFLTCGYFMLCVISSSSERANGRNIHIFQNSEIQPAFAEVECPSNLLHLYFELQPHA